MPWGGPEQFASAEKYEKVVKDCAAAKKLLDARGVIFGYHNHAHEYADGNDYIAKLTAEAELRAAWAVFWATVAVKDAGADMHCLSDMPPPATI